MAIGENNELNMSPGSKYVKGKRKNSPAKAQRRKPLTGFETLSGVGSSRVLLFLYVSVFQNYYIHNIQG
jgi:hypothetical protein